MTAHSMSRPDGSGNLAKPTLYCNFCGRPECEVGLLIAGPSVFICDQCTDLCGDIVPDWRVRRLGGDAIAIDARSGETAGLDPQGESATPQGDRP